VTPFSGGVDAGASINWHIAGWFKLDDADSQRRLIDKQSEYYIILNCEEGLLQIAGGLEVAQSYDTNWHFLQAWYDVGAGTINAQMDDGSVQSAAATFIPSGSSDFIVGGDVGNFNGLIDELGIWKRVLTPSERSTLYNSGNGLTYPFE
jgi:hypothetical protein